jgi:KDO2-lipid IV(A) lauroyltransferase
MFGNLGMNVIETLRLGSVSDATLRDSIVMEGEERLRAVLARGKGLLVLSAHMGNWDLLCTMAPRLNYPTTIITKNLRNTKLNDYWMNTRARFGLKFVPAHHSYRLCLSALRRNEIVGFILDQNMIRDEGVFVNFMGRPACTSPGLAYMSAQSGAAVVPVFMIRLPEGRHLVKVLPEIPPPPDRQQETILSYTQRYTKAIEDMILQYPDQWIWIHRRWRTQPPNAADASPASQQSA